MELKLVGPELLLPSLPASSSRQLVRRRSVRDTMTSRGQRHKSPVLKRCRLAPPSPGNIAVVRPFSTTTWIKRDREIQRQPPTPKPPKQILSAKALGLLNPYSDDATPKDRRTVTQRNRRSPEVKTSNQQPLAQTSRSAFGRQSAPAFRKPALPPPCTRKRQNLRDVRAKVDSHLCSQFASHPCPPTKHRSRPPCQPVKNKSLAEAHQQLELLLTRIERATDYDSPPQSVAGTKKIGGTKVSKGVSRQMGQPPPVPAGSPMLSARSNYTMSQTDVMIGNSEEDRDCSLLPEVVPLVQNPQRLPPAQRDALLELLQRSEQHDKGIVDIVGSSTGDLSRDTMLMLLQMLPLSLDESPYSEKFWEGHRYLKERQKLQQKLRPGDERFKEVKVLRDPNGYTYFSRTLEEELQDEKKVLDYMEAEFQRNGRRPNQQGDNLPTGHPVDYYPLNDRQEKAMRERAELERHKQMVINCREQRRQKENQKQQSCSSAPEGNCIENPQSAESFDPWNSLLKDRDRFQAHCNRSCFYNNSRSSVPWKIYAKVASNLSSHLIKSLDVEFHRSVANYIKNLVGRKFTL
ncbi:uncharacterized protein LOC108103996 [Drosophila eugracilis]|uniref:uncharacterized protein LOC108103996 n=1 Tax=Drosophila eugracilis TaxID=29029 RepID=UPI001BDB3C91|nr:uncharacterized protein LOC108103996 [Drosophila eugracilis]